MSNQYVLYAAFNAVLDDGDEIWNFSFNIEIHAPVFEVLNPTIEDNNGDNVWDAGEAVTINVDLVNSGSAGFGYYPGAVITTDNPYITILSGENDNTYYGIDANSMYEGWFGWVNYLENHHTKKSFKKSCFVGVLNA